MEELKKVYSVSLTPIVQERSMRLASYNGYRSLSDLVDKLLIDWLTENDPEWEIQKMGDQKESPE